MSQDVVHYNDVFGGDDLAQKISRMWWEWNTLRQNWLSEKEEIRNYVFATDTSYTSGLTTPWRNKTTLPKLCQIRDNLHANYMAAMFPRRKWMSWEGSREEDETKEKRHAIEAYMQDAVERSGFKNTISALVYDYIDYGNCFAMPYWEDRRSDESKAGAYVGPKMRRVSPLDIVFNPIASSFEASPKVLRSLYNLGDLKKYLERLSTDDNREQMETVFNIVMEKRSYNRSGQLNLEKLDTYYQVDGFTNYQSYLESEYVEILTFYGDIYDSRNDELLQNHEIVVIDKDTVVYSEPNPSFFAQAPIYHAGWRMRQDNLWAMGPLDNLIGLQYRIDHLENLKADIFDLVAAPPLKIVGNVEDFEWGPFARIYVGDEGDISLMNPDTQALQANFEIGNYQNQMEEMAGAPKEAMGFRSPGEKTAYEVQRLENASSRIFANKIAWFESLITEPLLNAMLELAKRNLSPTTIRVFDDELNLATFQNLTPADISGSGQIRPTAARHFAEKAQMVQDLSNFFSSGIADESVRNHFSSFKIAKLFEELLNIQGQNIVAENVRIGENMQAQQEAQLMTEQNAVALQTPSGLTADDADEDLV